MAIGGSDNAMQDLQVAGLEEESASVRPVTRLAKVFSRLRRFGTNFYAAHSLPLSMASTPGMPWQHILRASLRECTYLPDPVARSYMRGYVMDRYRRAAGHPDRPENQKHQKARQGLSILRRANEGYQVPLEKVLLLSYGRIGKRRHELLNDFLKPPVPKDTDAVKALIAQPAEYEDGWEAPEIVMSLAKSQMHNGVIMTSRRRPRLSKLQPVIPEKNSWGRPLALVRRRNIRKQWYQSTLDCLYPPLPSKELGILDGLLCKTIPWEPVKRRRVLPTPSPSPSSPNTDDTILDFLTDGPQKGHTFREYVLGRPHCFTPRFMHRQWRRISALVPRMYQVPGSEKAHFIWDTPKPIPSVNSHVVPGADIDDIFGEIIVSSPKRKQSTAKQS